MIYIVENWLPITVATVVGTILTVVVMTKIARQSFGVAPFATTFIAEFWIAAILAGALILAPSEAGRWTMVLGTGVIIWIGFVMPAFVVSQRWRRAGWRATVTDAALWLVVILVQATVMELVGLVPPTQA